MQVQGVKNNTYNASFRSKFANTGYLKDAFLAAKIHEGPKFVRAIERLLNDGKSDIIDITAKHTGGSKTYRQMDLKVNGEVIDSIKHSGMTDGQKIQKIFDAKELIIRYAGLENAIIVHKPSSVVSKQLESLKKQIFI